MGDTIPEQWDIMTAHPRREELQQQHTKELADTLNISPNGNKTLSLIEKMLQHAYQYNTLSQQEEVQIISQLERMDFNKDWFSR